MLVRVIDISLNRWIELMTLNYVHWKSLRGNVVADSFNLIYRLAYFSKIQSLNSD